VAGEKLRRALALWRGPPLADLAYEPFARAAIARLEELRAAALEQRIEADLALGRHSQLVGELEGLVTEHPLRERLRGQLMLCLYRCGRQAEALESYQAARRVLVEELGIEPGRQLRELHQAILRQDPGLDLAPVAESPDEAPRGAFVGRVPELAELMAGLDDAFAGRGRLFLVVGEPGMPLAKRNAIRFCTASRPRKWSIRNTRPSGKTPWTSVLSSRALSRSTPNGFSSTTRARSASPEDPSATTISPNAPGGTER
jgi:hypothetical protein